MATAIITGGDSGIGLEFSKALAARHYDLVIISVVRPSLEKAKPQLEADYGVKVATVLADLSDPTAIKQVQERIRRTRHLAYFVNCAGFAVHADILDDSPKALALHSKAVQVMALDILTFSVTAANQMLKDNAGHIINVASTANWTFQGDYSAIKSYVVSFTGSLNLRLKDSNVTATAVCPSWMHTNFHKAADLGEPDIPEWMYMKPAEVVRAALHAADEGKSLVVPTTRWKIITWLLGHGPLRWRRRFTSWYINTSNYQKRR